nr:type IV pili twitching motility protein PilT [Gemmatimonadaceae bacterium]
RDPDSELDIVQLIKEGTVQYGMQTFDQSLLGWYSRGVITYEAALFHATNPSEFALQVQGVGSASDTSWDAFRGDTQG